MRLATPGPISAIVVALIGVAVIVQPRTPGASAPTLASDFVQPANCVECSTCAVSIEHRATITEGGDYKNSHPCIDTGSAFDCSGHPACDPQASLPEDLQRDRELRYAEMQRALMRAFDGDTMAVRELLENYGDWAEINVERKSLQVRGCTREFKVANLPLGPQQLATLDDLMPQEMHLARR